MAFMRGNLVECRALRNRAARASAILKFTFYQKHVQEIRNDDSRDWWK